MAKARQNTPTIDATPTVFVRWLIAPWACQFLISGPNVGWLRSQSCKRFDELAKHKIECSVSHNGNCYDNAVAESFFGLRKRERVNRTKYRTRDEARADIFDYIEVFYNRKRRHGYLGNISPVDFEKRSAKSLETVHEFRAKPFGPFATLAMLVSTSGFSGASVMASSRRYPSSYPIAD